MGEITERAAVRRLHDRLGFGARAGSLDGGFDAAVAKLLGAAADTGLMPPPALPELMPPTKAEKKAERRGEGG